MERILILLSGIALAGCSSPWDGPLPDPHQVEIGEGSAESIEQGGLIRVARFDAEVLVLSRREYETRADDPLSAYSPVDLAVAWGDAARLGVRSQFRIQQPWRRYSWRYEVPTQKGDPEPIDVSVFRHGSANWHIVPSSASISRDIMDVEEGEVVRLSGYLVDARRADGGMMRTSMTRLDEGDGACEIFLVERMGRPR